MRIELPSPQAFTPEAPLPLMPQQQPAMEYPLEALGPLRDVVDAVHRATQAPAAIPAQSALAVAALATQGLARVQTLSGQFVPLSLYCLTIAESGERKSTCDNMIKRGVDEFEAELRDRHKLAYAKYQDAKELWRIKKDAAKQKVKSCKDPVKLVALEAEFQSVGQEPAPPLQPIRTMSDPTYEGMVRLFAEGYPSLGLLHDEGGQFFGGYAMITENKMKTLAAMNGLWDGRTIQRTRAGDGAFALPGRALSLHLLAQPSAAVQFLSDGQAEGLGFTARCLLTHPVSTQGTRFINAAVTDTSAVDAFRTRILDIMRLPMSTSNGGQELKRRELTLSPDAQDSLRAFYNKVEAMQADGQPFARIRGFSSKAAEHACRIAGVTTLFQDAMAVRVERTALEDGLRLVSYYLSEAKRIADFAPVAKDMRDAEELRRWLHEKFDGSAVTVTQMIQRGPNRLRTASIIKKLVGILLNSGHLVEQARSIIDASSSGVAYKIVGK